MPDEVEKCEYGVIGVWHCGRKAGWALKVSEPRKIDSSVTFYVCGRHMNAVRSSFGPLLDVEIKATSWLTAATGWTG